MTVLAELIKAWAGDETEREHVCIIDDGQCVLFGTGICSPAMEI